MFQDSIGLHHCSQSFKYLEKAILKGLPRRWCHSCVHFSFCLLSDLATPVILAVKLVNGSVCFLLVCKLSNGGSLDIFIRAQCIAYPTMLAVKGQREVLLPLKSPAIEVNHSQNRVVWTVWVQQENLNAFFRASVHTDLYHPPTRPWPLKSPRMTRCAFIYVSDTASLKVDMAGTVFPCLCQFFCSNVAQTVNLQGKGDLQPTPHLSIN